MKDITISIDDEVYRVASEEAARQRKSLSELVHEFLTRLRTKKDLAQFIDELNTEPCNDGPSVGPLNREELHHPGGRMEAESATDEAKRAEFLAQLQELFDQADERDRSKAGRLVPFTREEIYAERLDRIR